MVQISFHSCGLIRQALFASQLPLFPFSIGQHVNVLLFLLLHEAHSDDLLLRNHSQNLPFWISIERAAISMIFLKQLLRV